MPDQKKSAFPSRHHPHFAFTASDRTGTRAPAQIFRRLIRAFGLFVLAAPFPPQLVQPFFTIVGLFSPVA